MPGRSPVTRSLALAARPGSRAGALLLLLLAGAALPLRAQRSTWSMNPDWRVLLGDVAGAERPSFDDAGWKRVSLPYAWNED